jgi:hypothetical protein
LAIGSPPREGQAFLLKLDPDTSLGEALDQLAQVIQIAGQPIHAVDDDGIAFAGESERASSWGRLTSLPDALSVKVDRATDLPLAIHILIERADPDIADPCPFTAHSLDQNVRLKSMMQRHSSTNSV